MTNVEQLQKVVSELVEMGFKVSIDQMGGLIVEHEDYEIGAEFRFFNKEYSEGINTISLTKIEEEEYEE